MLRVVRYAALAVSLILAARADAAWPEQPVTLVVPFSAGGITDTLARITAERLQNAFKQTFVVENDGGGAGIIGATRVARASPDGLTLLFAPIFLVTFAPFSHNVEFDPLKDFAPVAIVAQSPFVITVGGLFPANSLAEFIAYVKSKPGELTFGSAGAGSLTHISAVVFLNNAGLDMIHVPYKGVGPAFTDLLAGHIHMLSATPVELMPYLASRKVKPLGVSSKERSRFLPDTPPIAETQASPQIATYNGLLAPARTPRPIIDSLAREIKAAQTSAPFLERLAQVGVEPATTTPEEVAALIAEDSARWRDLVKELGLQIR